jgi:hypothetical protein
MKKYPTKQSTILLAASLLIIIFVFFFTNGHKQNQKNTTSFQEISIPDNYKIMLSTITIDTRKPDVYIKNIIKSEPSEINLFIVQFDGPILEIWRKELTKYGDIIGYNPNNGFIIRMQKKNVNIITNIQHVQWVGYFHPDYKYYKSLLNSGNPEQKVELTILTTPQADSGKIISGIENLGGTIIGKYTTNKFGGNLRIKISNGNIPETANIKDVIWIEVYTEPQLSN